jgi:hypothetical protein
VKLITLAPLGLLTLACAANQPGPAPAAYTPQFDFAPPSNAAPGSAGVAVALVNATYIGSGAVTSGGESWSAVPPFSDFSHHMSLDFQEVLSARGFTVRGPFASYDELTFPDKSNSDLILTPTLDVSFRLQNIRATQNLVLLGPKTMKLEGDFTVGGRVTLSVNESLSNQRMWYKSIDIPNTVVHWKGKRNYLQGATGPNMSDPGLAEPLGQTLQGIYAKILRDSWDYVDPAEMAVVKRQSLELRSRWMPTSSH